jgi:Dolichyl-phosphate-mannose-protein mannosyltransferase
MNAATPSVAGDQHYISTDKPEPNELQQSLRAWQRALHPVTVICAVQAALSLTLVWSNTAFEDEAQFLWVGRLLVAHWLNGTPWPSAFADGNFSGSPLIYPPLAALADSVTGLAGARILSLVFMLCATLLLYLTASRLFGRVEAIFATVLWAISEPVIRLAFGTYDALSILLTVLAVWAIMQFGPRRSRMILVALAAFVLALANVTAYSGIVIDPIVILFAFLVWLPCLRTRLALLYAALLAGESALLLAVLMTFWGSWAGASFSVFNRTSFTRQSLLVVADEIWQYSGLIVALAIVSAVVAIGAVSRARLGLLALSGCATLIVPLAQLHAETAESLDKHLAYGIWFGAIGAGYTCKAALKWIPGAGKRMLALCCIVALIYPAANSWDQAWARFHGWANARQLVASLRPIVAHSSGLFYVPWHESYVTEYYVPFGYDWTRWNTSLSLDPVAVPASGWEQYYAAQLRRHNYAAVTLFYSTTFSSAPELPGKLLLSPNGNATNQELLGLVGATSGEPGLPELTLALEEDPDYHLAAVGPYDAMNDNAIYVIWQRKVRP